MKIAVGNDHIGVKMKQDIIQFLNEKGIECIDFGAYTEERTDYPIYAEKVANAVLSGECDKGILICGTGIGISIAANKFKGIRAVVCSEPYSAKLSREHNDTNILAFGAKVIGEATAYMIVEEFLKAQYEGGRHQKRIDMISQTENARCKSNV